MKLIILSSLTTLISATCDGEPRTIPGGVWTCTDRETGDNCFLTSSTNDGACSFTKSTCKKNGKWKVSKKATCGNSCSNSRTEKVLFEDNFSFFDLDKWQHENSLSGGGNWEFQYYTNNRSNSYVHDNTLFIKPTFMADYTNAGENMLTGGEFKIWGGDDANYCTSNDYWGCARTGTQDNYLNPIISAKIRTMKSFSFKYGTVSFKAKLPKGDWLWPAVWLLPKHGAYGGWPSSGEIDILESRGNIDYKCEGHPIDSNCVFSTLHWGPRYHFNRYERTTGQVCDHDYAADFHDYRLEWTENGIKTFIDNTPAMDVDMTNSNFWDFGEFPEGMDNPWQYNSKMAPFDQEFYIIINLAVGGTNHYFPDQCTNAGGKPWLNTSPTAPKDFWLGRSSWEPTWGAGEDRAFQIKDFKVTRCD